MNMPALASPRMPRRLAALCLIAVLMLMGRQITWAAETTAATEPARPRIALVPSGGGARGFAHVGVLRALKDLRGPIDIVTGVSGVLLQSRLERSAHALGDEGSHATLSVEALKAFTLGGWTGHGWLNGRGPATAWRRSRWVAFCGSPARRAIQ